MRRYDYLSFDERKEIERMVRSDTRTEEIAHALNRNISTIYRELSHGLTDERGDYMQRLYSAKKGQKAMQDAFKKRGKPRE